jgi:hypothetical protein
MCFIFVRILPRYEAPPPLAVDEAFGEFHDGWRSMTPGRELRVALVVVVVVVAAAAVAAVVPTAAPLAAVRAPPVA